MAGLAPEKLPQALRMIQAWRLDPAVPRPCPACGEKPLTIIDQSARPYTEWYALSCPACGLEQTISIPLGTPMDGG